jgi:soluble lytic murein transglycosylase
VRSARDFLDFYQEPQPVELQCYALQARLNTDGREDITEETEKLWLAGESQPESCDPVFEVLYASTRMTNELVWQRIRLAMANGKLSLATYLARRLPEEDQAWVRRWEETYRRPAKMMEDPAFDKDTALTREILLHGLHRIARYNPALARSTWQSLASSHAFTPEQGGELLRYIALVSAYQHRPEASAWLAEVPDEFVDDRVREWRIRSALGERDWAGVLRGIDALDAEQTQEGEWRYWRAYALEHTGDRLDAVNLFTLLSGERSYHGFLAADFMDWKYSMDHLPLSYTDAQLQAVRSHPGIVRARELFRAGLIMEARREWQHTIRGFPPDDLGKAAVIADRWGWHNRAIMTVARAGQYSDLELRFPLQHKDLVIAHARRASLDPGLVFGVIRQESAFMLDARSRAGALGLMQLMPMTGKLTAQKNHIPLPSTEGLFAADKNILIGTTYLRQVMERFDGNTVLAVASYNAGPHRVERWLPDEEGEPAEIWGARIPFSETRHYVQRVLAYATIYDWRMQLPVVRLRDRMPVVNPAKTAKR